MEKLKKIKKPVIVHYSCASWDDPLGDEVYNLNIYAGNQFVSFKADTEAEEAEAIRKFAKKVNELRESGCTIIHWAQDSLMFGPDHIKSRYKEITGEDIDLGYGTDSVNLAWDLIQEYGDDYADHPRLDSLARLNGFSGIESEEPCPLFNHMRTALIVKIYFRAMSGTLRTNTDRKRIDSLKGELLQEMKKELRGEPGGTEKVLSRKDVMEMLDISAPTLTSYVKEGKIPHTRIGRKLYFLKSEIMKTQNPRQ